MVFLGGLLGSSHCIGMCGGFALALGSNRFGLAANLARQVVYSLGRVFTYATFGLAAGYGGWRLATDHRGVVNVQAVLCILAGVLLILQGLHATGLLSRFSLFAGKGPCLLPGLFGSLLRQTRLASVFLGGVVNGLLPCGLVYAFVALAASSGTLWRGGLTMLLFGLGTLPVMALVGCGGQVLGVAARRHVLTIAAWCVVLTGVLSIVRGLGFLPFFTTAAEPSCPLCP